MALDDLYGPGTEDALRALLPGADVVTSTAPDGSVGVRGSWADSVVKFVCFPERVHFTTLRGTGRYAWLCARLPVFFRERGVDTFTASARDEQSARILRRAGFEGDLALTHPLAADDRMSQYTAWKAGGTEPGWHKELTP